MGQYLNLNNYNASGVYTLEVDQSQNISLPLNTGRLIIGSSKVGPINTVVLLNDTNSATAIYGNIDSKMEKNGSFFHRTLAVSLRQGPVYALNLLPISDTDTAFFATFNTESASNNSNWSSSTNKDSISHFYNTQKLWYADIDQVSKTKNNKLGDKYPATGDVSADSNKIFSVVNLSKTPITVWTRKATTSGYNITVGDFYQLFGNNAEIPQFINTDDIVADYFVEIIVVQGDWTNNPALSVDPVYGQYFDASGIIISKLDSFLSLRQVTVVNRTVGSIIPDFIDLSNQVASIDTLFNRYFSQTGVFIALDHLKVDKMDLSQPAFQSGTSVEPIEEQRLDIVGYGFDELNTSVYKADDGISELGISPVGLISVLSYIKPSIGNFNFKINHLNWNSNFAAGQVYTVNNGTTTIVATEGSTLYSAWSQGFINTGDLIQSVSQPSNTPVTQYLYTDGLVKTQSLGQVNYIVFYAYSDITLSNVDVPGLVIANTSNYLNIVNADFDQFKAEFDLLDSNFFITSGPGLYQYFAPNQLVVTLDPSLYGNPAKKETPNSGIAYNATNRQLIENFFVTGQYVKAGVATNASGEPVIRERLLRIKSVSAQSVFVNGAQTLKYTIITDSPSDANILGIDLSSRILSCYKGIANYVTNLAGTLIPAMSIDTNTLYPNGTASRQDYILNWMFNNTNIASTIADKETLNFRYIIDSYGGQISPSSKQQLVQLAANHGQALAILNAPSFADYAASVDPSFIDITTDLVSTEYIATGGNLSSNPAYTFGFAQGSVNGIPISSFAAYWMPNLLILENGKNKLIPPSAYVGNVFMNKFTSGNTFSIAAGKRGIIGDPEVSGLEYNLTDDDRANLEPVGFNLIVNRRGFGVMLYSNNTAYQTVKSSLNNIHVRESLITVERDINRILINFLFDFNDPTTQMRVKTLVKNYLTAVQDANGISTFDIIFDTSNNGDDVLNANAGLIDVIVDFPKGIQKFINRITITRSGGNYSSNSSGFTPSF